MKTLFGCGIGFGAVSMVLFCGVSNAQTMLVNDFGDGVQSWRFDYGGPSSTLSQDPTEGSPDNAAGALRMDMGFAPSNNRNDYAFTGDVFFPATDLTGFDALEFDLKIADGAALDAFGNHGFFRFQSRETDGYSGNSVVSGNLAPETGVWKRYSVSTDALLATRAFTFYLYGGPSQNIDGDITIFLDNIRLTTAVPEPSSLVMAALLACTGLGFRRR